jgi:hypothetical protein
MAKPFVPPSAGWDPFFQQVQKDLIEPLGLENVIISVDRHQGENGKVGVTLSPHHLGTNAKDSAHDVLVFSKKQLTVYQLTEEIQSILDVLLHDCAVRFGDITFVVNQGVLKETVFSFSTRPHESSASFFVV